MPVSELLPDEIKRCANKLKAINHKIYNKKLRLMLDNEDENLEVPPHIETEIEKYETYIKLIEEKIKCLTYHSWLVKLDYLMQNFRWRGDVIYPSTQAKINGFSEWDHFALSGDGLFLLGFEILSYEGNGLIRFVNLSKQETLSFWVKDFHDKYEFGQIITFIELVGFIKHKIVQNNKEKGFR